MLHLAAPSRPDWLPSALANLDTILLDHAHCEKKAASSAMNLIFRYQMHPELMRPLSEHSREELEHFELMLQVLDDRDIVFVPLEPSRYAPELLKVVRKGEPERMIDTLLCCALIEARSCERMKLLADAMDGSDHSDLAALYRELLPTEAHHFTLFVNLACTGAPQDVVMARLDEIALHEAEVLAALDGPVRMHS